MFTNYRGTAKAVKIIHGDRVQCHVRDLRNSVQLADGGCHSHHPADTFLIPRQNGVCH